jgi:5-methyltetrahydropteroyltriglutamate--homocysteine methyltransferase
VLTVTRDRPLVTTTAGALPRPSWFTANLAGRPFSVAMADRAYREQYLDAQATYIVDQCRAGIDVLVDGDARLDDGFAGRHWIAYVEERLRGIGPPEMRDYPIHRGKRAGEIMYEVMETRIPGTVCGHVGRDRLEYDLVWKTSQALTEKPVKLGGISAQLVEASLNNAFYADRRELVMDLSAALNDEYHALAAAGCPVIQVEEPCIHGIAGTAKDAMLSPEFYVEAFNREVRGLRAKTELWCHTCWGSPAAQRTRDRAFSYAAAIPYLDQLDVDVLMFEAKETEGADLELIGRGVGKDKKVAIGVISHRTLQIERPEEVAALVRKALLHIEPERLILSSDCGFGRQGMSRIHAFYKMVSMTLGANIVRKELGLDPVEVRAADPRFRLIPPG